jgi:acyl carrier protein
MPDRLLTFDEFREGLSRAFNVPMESLREETNFLEDLSFDSLRMLQLGMVFEALEVEMPEEMAWGIQTVGEAYAYYTAAAPADGAAGDRSGETVG